jgi:hypothetical protein
MADQPNSQAWYLENIVKARKRVAPTAATRLSRMRALAKRGAVTSGAAPRVNGRGLWKWEIDDDDAPPIHRLPPWTSRRGRYDTTMLGMAISRMTARRGSARVANGLKAWFPSGVLTIRTRRSN